MNRNAAHFETVMDVHKTGVLGLKRLHMLRGAGIGDDVKYTPPLRVTDGLGQVDDKRTVLAV